MDASRHLNPFMEDRKIKLEGLDVREQILLPGDFQSKQDLDSGYWHVPLHPDHRKFVGVHFKHDNGTHSYWMWNVLFLGVKDAVYIFTKLLAPHKRFLRSLGIRMSIYIDDQSVLGHSFEDCVENTRFACECLSKAGWVLNVKKSSDAPVQNLEFLGLMNCSVSMKYFIPSVKLVNLKELISEVLSCKRVHIKVLAKLLGKLQFCERALGPVVRLLSRSSYYLIAKASSWNSFLTLSESAKMEFLYLFENLESLNGFPIRASKSAIKLDFSFCSDASDIGFCVYCINSNNDILLKKVFSEEEARKSSTFRELLAFHAFYTKEAVSSFKNSNILHYTDNLNCETILSVGSRNFNLQPLVLDIFLAWKKHNIKVLVKYVSREDPKIIFADQESRNFDLHDYSLDFNNFLWLSRMFGPFVLDCFASASNKKCVDYYSKFHDNVAVGVNFFAQKIPLDNLFVFPPVHLIIPALKHLQLFKSFGCLVVPFWPSSYFWTFICADGVHFDSWVKNVLIFSPFFQSGEYVRNEVFQGVKKFSSLALQFDFSQEEFHSQCSPRFCSLKGCFKCL